MRKIIIVFMAIAAIALGCDEVKKALEASPDVSCGRFCIKCSECKGQGSDSTFKAFVDFACAIDDLGIACQELCERGGDLVPGIDVKKNTENIETQKDMQVNDAKFSCDDFAYGVVTGDLTGPCARFCKKCVQCAPQVSDDTATWCAKEDGIVCAKACESQFIDWVVKFENAVKKTNLESIDDINCADWSATAQEAGPHP